MKLAVLFIGNFLSATKGIAGVSEMLAQRFREAGWTIFVASTKPGRLARTADMLAATWRWRAHYQIAHIEVYSGFAFCWAEWVSTLLAWLNKPFVLTLHGGSLPVFAQRWPRRVTRLLKRAAAVTVPSPYLLERMRPYRQDLHLLPNALQLAAYPSAVRHQVSPRLVWLRAFHTVYHPTMAVRVLAELAKEFPDVQLTMIGSDKGDGALHDVQQLAETLGVTQRLTLTGAIAKAAVPAALAEHDVFLNTTHVDNAPVSVTEAMACGLCVVSTAVDGIPYLLENERDALLVPDNDVTAMVAAVKRLLVQPGLSERLSRQGRRRVESYDWEQVFLHWENLFAKVLTR